jgi:hypothetical protein
MYRVTEEWGNDYHCSCCRQTWTATEDFDNEQDMIEYLVKMKKSKEDWQLEEIREIKDEDLTNKYEEIVQILIDNSNKVKARKHKLEQLKKNLTEDEIC